MEVDDKFFDRLEAAISGDKSKLTKGAPADDAGTITPSNQQKHSHSMEGVATEEEVKGLRKSVDDLTSKLNEVSELFNAGDDKTEPGAVMKALSILRTDGETYREALEGITSRLERVEKTTAVRKQTPGDDFGDDEVITKARGEAGLDALFAQIARAPGKAVTLS